MKNETLELKKLALKIYFLNQDQRRYLSAGIDALPVELQNCIDGIDFRFPLLRRLSKNQRLDIFRELISQAATKNGWESVRERIDLMKQNGPSYPTKLSAILFEQGIL
jgi:hypothetical protein